MRIETRPWKLDLGDLWWNKNRSEVYASIMGQLGRKHIRAHLTGAKGVGKSTMAILLTNRIEGAEIVRVDDQHLKTHEFNVSYLIIDEAQKISEEDRQLIMHKNPITLMVSVRDLSDDGYDTFVKIEDLTVEEVESYIESRIGFTAFTKNAMAEISVASRGRPRLINLLCNTAMDEHGEVNKKIDKKIVRHVAMKKFKLRY